MKKIFLEKFNENVKTQQKMKKQKKLIKIYGNKMKSESY